MSKTDQDVVELSENAKKYKTLARAVFANDAEACNEIYKYLKNQGKEFTEEEIQSLGMRWFMNKEREIDVAKFLHEMGFNFEQVIILDPQNERTGVAIPFRLIGDEDDERVLIDLLKHNIVSTEVSDGMGDSLICEALQKDRFELADNLLAVGVDINHQNIAQQTSMHIMAAKLNFRAIKWLGENKADPGVEDIRGAVASQMVPETLEDWDTDSMYELLENYVESHDNGGGFSSSEEFDAMVDREEAMNNPGDEEDNDATWEELNDTAGALIKSNKPN